MPVLFINSLHLLFPVDEGRGGKGGRGGGGGGQVDEKEGDRDVMSLPKEAPSFTTIKSLTSTDDSSLLIGSDTGFIFQVSRFIHCQEDSLIYPGLTYHQVRDTTFFSAVSCIDLHPVDTRLFLVSFADGSVSLFERGNFSDVISSEVSKLQPQAPLMTWDSCDTQVCQDMKVEWLPSCNSAFVTFAPASSSIVFWDLNTCVWNPLFKYQLTK